MPQRVVVGSKKTTQVRRCFREFVLWASSTKKLAKSPNIPTHAPESSALAMPRMKNGFHQRFVDLLADLFLKNSFVSYTADRLFMNKI